MKRNKGNLSKAQLETACAIFGNKVSPECERINNKAIDYEQIAADIFKQIEPQVNEVISRLAAEIESMTESILAIDERLRMLESNNKNYQIFGGKQNGHAKGLAIDPWDNVFNNKDGV